ncbi:MAG TPA: hypothetical protein VEI08_00545 [Candidatus Bathyarchaeia archaeon]|nr:hypothetical protein [Candidatus Bathyarchaeia archaeon]
MTKRQKPLEEALEAAVSRALRDNLVPLQRTADELQQAYSDLVAACSSSRPTNALPAMLRAQTAASALAAGLSVLSNFVAVALKPREGDDSEEDAGSAVEVAEAEVEAPAADTESEWAESKEREEVPAVPVEIPIHTVAIEPTPVEEAEPEPEPVSEVAAFDIASLPTDQQDLHRRANRVAKVAMQDIKLLRPKDVRLGREHKDICVRLRADLDKARKEYDRRFRAIQDHPVDYFHQWMVEILGEGDPETLGEYPYPSPVLRH